MTLSLRPGTAKRYPPDWTPSTTARREGAAPARNMVDYDGDDGRGLVAVCQRDTVSLVDAALQEPVDSETAQPVQAYRLSLGGDDPMARRSSGKFQQRESRHLTHRPSALLADAVPLFYRSFYRGLRMTARRRSTLRVTSPTRATGDTP